MGGVTQSGVVLDVRELGHSGLVLAERKATMAALKSLTGKELTHRDDWRRWYRRSR